MDPSSTVDPSTIFSAKGLVVAITGGGSGIGLAMAAAIAKTGCKKLYLLGRRADVLNSAAAQLSSGLPASSAPVVVPLVADVTSAPSLAAAASRIESETGYLDVLINNAGVIGPPNKPALTATSITELQSVLLTGFSTDADSSSSPIPGDHWDATLRTNVSSVVLASATFLPLLDAGNARRGWASGRVDGDAARERHWTPELGSKTGVAEDDKRQSQIVTVASIAGFNRGITAGVAYSASKAAAVHVGKILATLLVPWGVRSNVIAPGIYPSAMTGEHDSSYPVSQVPAGRKGDFNDIAGVILYLVGKGGAYVNGQVQVTDGGRLAGFPSTY